MKQDATPSRDSSDDANQRRCLQCDHPLQPAKDFCIECGAPAEWTRGAHALRGESVHPLRSIRMGAGMLALGWAMLVAILVGLIVIRFGTGRNLVRPEQLLFSILNVTILGLFLVGAFQLRPRVRKWLDVIRRPLNAGFTEIVAGVMLAGAPSVLNMCLAAVTAMNLTTTAPSGLLNATISIMFLGWVLCGLGCRNIARTYLRQLHERPPLRTGLRRLADLVLLAVVAVILGSFLVFLGSRLVPGGLAGRQFTMIAAAILPLLIIAFTLAGALGMFRLWYGVRKLLKTNQRPAPSN